MRAFKRLLLLLLCACASATGKSSSFVESCPSKHVYKTSTTTIATELLRGGGFIPAGWNPFGYKISKRGEQYLTFGGALDGDVGRFLSTLKARKTFAALKLQWVEIVKVTKTGQTMRIYRRIDDLLKFCLEAGLID